MTSRIFARSLLVLTVTACTASKQPSQDNLLKPMTDYLASHGDLCVDKSVWPIDVTHREVKSQSRNAVQLPVLEQLGLVRSSLAHADIKNNNDVVENVEVMRYELTEEGNKYYLHKEMHSMASDGGTRTRAGDFCAAHLTLDKIISWDKPVVQDASTSTVVHFTYKVEPAPWANDPGIRQVFPMVARIMDGASVLQLQESFIWTAQGWLAKDR